MENPFDQFDENPFDAFDSPEASPGFGEIPKRMLGVPTQTAIDLGVGTGAFLGGLPYWLIEFMRSGGDIGSANKAFDATSGYIGQKGLENTRITKNPWVQEQTGKITGFIGDLFKSAEEGAGDIFQHIEPSATSQQSGDIGKAGVIFGSLFGPKLVKDAISGIRGIPEPPLIRLPKETPSTGAHWKPGYERYQTQVQPDLFPETIKEFLPTVEEAPIVPKTKPIEPIQPDLFSIPTKVKPETRIFQESGIVDPRYVPPGFFEKPITLPQVPQKESGYQWKDSPSNVLDNLYVRALKSVGGDESHPLYTGLRRMEADILLKKSEFDPVRDAWLDAYRGLRGAEKEVLDNILYSKNPSRAREFFNSRQPGMGDALANMLKSATDARFKELAEVYPELKYNPDFFPRVVKDTAGLSKALASKGRKADSDKIIKLQKDYDAGNITPLEFQSGLDKIVLKKWEPSLKAPTTSHAKDRAWPSVPKEYQKYYEHPLRALNEYFNETGQTLVERKFLGKGKISDAITARMEEAQGKGLLTAQQAKNFEELLKVRFAPEARRGPDGGMRAAKDIGYAATIGNPLSAAIQILDVIPSSAKYGVMNTLNAALKSAMPKFLGRERMGTVEPARLGLKDIAHDINVSVGTVGKGSAGARKVAEIANYALDSLLKVTGFKAADRFGKRAIMTAALNKYSKMAKKGKTGDAYLEKKGFRNLYKTDAEFKAFKDALARKDVADIRVREAMVMELLDMQPISISSMPVSYIRHPQGRIMYMLKTWAIRQINTIREANLKGRKGEALKLTGALVLSNMAAPMMRDLIRSLWSDTAVEDKDLSDYTVAALLRILMMDRYASQLTETDSVGGGVKIAAKALKESPGAIAPPQINMGWLLMNDIGDFLNDESKWKSLQYVPITGPYLRDKLKDKE